MSEFLISAIINNAFWLTIFIVGVTLFRQQIRSLISSLGTFSFAGSKFEFKDKKATLESYTILTNILLDVLSESASAKQLGDMISGANARQLQRFINQYIEEVPPADWDIELLKNVGIIFRRKVSNQAALIVFRLLQKQVSPDREILDELGYTLLRTGVQKDAEEAEQIYRELLRTYHWRHLYHRHGVACAALDNFPDAIRDLEIALSLKYGERDPKMLDTSEYPYLQRLKTEKSVEFKQLLSKLETQISAQMSLQR